MNHVEKIILITLILVEILKSNSKKVKRKPKMLKKKKHLFVNIKSRRRSISNRKS